MRELSKVGTLPQGNAIIPPEGGWKADTVYAVLVSYRAANPLHYALLQVGFLRQNMMPGSYTSILCNTYDEAYSFSDIYRLEVVRELCTMSSNNLEFPS